MFFSNKDQQKIIKEKDNQIKLLSDSIKEKLSQIIILQKQNNELAKTINELNKETENAIWYPAYLGIIDYEQVSEILKKTGITKFSLSDNYFQTTSMEEAKRYSELSKINRRKWKEEDHDCDNFSYALLGYWSEGLKSYAFGYARSKNHAFNIMIDNQKTIWICEPQTNKWFKYKDNSDSKYKVTEVLL